MTQAWRAVLGTRPRGQGAQPPGERLSWIRFGARVVQSPFGSPTAMSKRGGLAAGIVATGEGAIAGLA